VPGGQRGHSVQRGDASVAAIRRRVFVFIKRFVRQRDGRDRLAFESPRPIQDDLQSVGKAGDLELVDQGQVGRVVADKLSKVLGRKKGRPGFSAGAISPVEKIAGLEPAAASLSCVGQALPHWTPPEAYVCVELLMNLCPPLGVVESFVHPQGKPAKFVS